MIARIVLFWLCLSFPALAQQTKSWQISSNPTQEMEVYPLHHGWNTWSLINQVTGKPEKWSEYQIWVFDRHMKHPKLVSIVGKHGRPNGRAKLLPAERTQIWIPKKDIDTTSFQANGKTLQQVCQGYLNTDCVKVLAKRNRIKNIQVALSMALRVPVSFTAKIEHKREDDKQEGKGQGKGEKKNPPPSSIFKSLMVTITFGLTFLLFLWYRRAKRKRLEKHIIAQNFRRIFQERRNISPVRPDYYVCSYEVHSWLRPRAQIIIAPNTSRYAQEQETPLKLLFPPDQEVNAIIETMGWRSGLHPKVRATEQELEVILT